MDLESFKTVFSLWVLVGLANAAACIMLWIAGNKKRSKQRMWARRLWSANTFYLFFLFLS